MQDIDDSVFAGCPVDQYEYCSWLPIDTNMRLDNARRQLIRHNSSHFIWVDGSENAFPYAIVPLKATEEEELYGFSRAKAFDDLLDYISRLSLHLGCEIDVHSEYYTGYRAFWASVLEYRAPWVPRNLNTSSLRCVTLPTFPIPLEDGEKLAVGFFRESLSSKNVFYSLLVCVKAIEYFYPKHQDRNTFIDSRLREAVTEYAKYNKLRGIEDLERFLRFAEREAMTPGEYLHKGCRHAIAHATRGDRYVQASRFADLYEMYYAREMARALTLLLILDRFGNKLIYDGSTSDWET